MKLARSLAGTALIILMVGGVLPTLPTIGRPVAAQTAQPAAPAPPLEVDAHQTREALQRVLERYPPAVGRVLKLDPSLLANQAYLAAYPGLAAFLASHPEVAHNPGFFLAGIEGGDSGWQPTDPKTAAIQMWRGMYDDLGAFLVFLVVTGSLIWLVRTLLEWRRWTRLSRLHADTHTKILDRFASNQELMSYIETPVGRRFLESGPVLSDGAPRPLGAPVSRILWSVQAGVVLAVAGLGLLFVSRRVMEEVAEGLWVFGVLALALGLGFVLSAGLAYLISQRMGLFEPMLGRRTPGPVDAV